MTHRMPRHHWRLLAALVGAIATLCISMALSAPPASASPYCGGQRLSNYGLCYGAARSLSGVTGYGTERSICLGAGAIWGGCSGGPGQIRTMNLGFTDYLSPWIQVNASGSTIVYGETL